MNIANNEQASSAGFGGYAGVPQPREQRRAWRVGSLSMGITLMLIGTAFAVSLWQDTEAYEMLMWVAPVVFILLGAELLIYLGVAGKQDTLVRYDWLSVFFVGVIGIASLVLALFMSSGLFDEIRQDMKRIQRTAFVESDKIVVPEGVSNVIVQSAGEITIDQTSSRELHLMGQVRYWSAEAANGAASGMLRTNTVGSDLYVFIGSPDWEKSGNVEALSPQLILTVPEGVTVEQRPF
ncbi:hypothetical protein [Paenibacillus soyae]|uniref:Uncharacterized protein n=1 Tax=Paenibacillus soyae TaxID=2969249 RepID=A0A9X2MSB7_9BACL|nr:hypothetical protein [Paenibacillus soyae]MCR2805289.1 hypothetical protein [Paenibacillus soyae]